MSMPPYIRSAPEGSHLRVRVTPRASCSEIGEPSGDTLRLRVTAPPVDHAANEAVVQLLADALNLRRSAVVIIRGQTARQKTLLIAGLVPTEVLSRLHLS